jgi:protease-4
MSSGGSSWASKLFFALLAIQLLPGAVKVVKTFYQNIVVPKTKVGVVTISGEIREGTRIVYEMKSLLENQEIRALVLRIDSPGGAPGASQAIYDAIRKLSKKHAKPIVAWVENIGASGGYYIAAAADYIVCTASALVGSVGVYMTLPYLKDFVEQYKVRCTVLKSGKYKAATHFCNQLTSEQEALFSTMLHEIHERFIEDILAVRTKLAGKDRRLWAEGQPINGEKALEIGLVDEIGSQLTVEEVVKRLADITTELEWVKPTKKSPLAKLLGGEDADDDYPYMKAFVDHLASYVGYDAKSSPMRVMCE